MAMKDISDLQVCEAYAESERQRAKSDWQDYEFPYVILQRMTGQPEKVCYRAMERAADRDLVEYGVSLRTGWLTKKGREFLSPPHQIKEEEMQKFHKGDWVKVAKDLGPHMSHFPAGCEAIVIGSYADQYGGRDHRNYTLHLKDLGETSWYEEDQLTLIEPARMDLLKQWENESEAEATQTGDLDWIFSHGREVIAAPHGASIQALAACFGLTNLWGARGEGITYYANVFMTMSLAKPYLERGDKTEWLRKCAEVCAN